MKKNCFEMIREKNTARRRQCVSPYKHLGRTRQELYRGGRGRSNSSTNARQQLELMRNSAANKRAEEAFATGEAISLPKNWSLISNYSIDACLFDLRDPNFRPGYRGKMEINPDRAPLLSESPHGQPGSAKCLTLAFTTEEKPKTPILTDPDFLSDVNIGAVYNRQYINEMTPERDGVGTVFEFRDKVGDNQ